MAIGVLIISHGSRNREWVRLVDEAVERMSVTEMIVVPLFVSSGSKHVEEI